MGDFFLRIGRLDRRVIFVLIALSVILPLLTGLVFPIKPSEIVRNIYDRMESLPPGSRVSTVSCPMAFSVVARREIWVDLPAPSPPSSVINRPRATISLPHFPTTGT